MGGFYDRLGDILRDRLDSDADPFETWEPNEGKPRSAGDRRERTPPPRRSSRPERIAVPDELVEDFRVLGLPPGVPLADCKAAWKRLLKRYHPDHHALDGDTERRNTDVSVRLTASFRRISSWFETGDVPAGS